MPNLLLSAIILPPLDAARLRVFQPAELIDLLQQKSTVAARPRDSKATMTLETRTRSWMSSAVVAAVVIRDMVIPFLQRAVCLLPACAANEYLPSQFV